MAKRSLTMPRWRRLWPRLPLARQP
jgi:hypothetical protein